MSLRVACKCSVTKQVPILKDRGMQELNMTVESYIFQQEQVEAGREISYLTQQNRRESIVSHTGGS